LAATRYLLSLLFLAILGISPRPQAAHATYYAPSMEYGAGVFPMGHSETTDRDFDAMAAAGLSWARISIPWRSVEPSCKNCYDWSDVDRVVGAAAIRGIRIIARLDRPPAWAQTIPVDNGPPDNPQDFVDFVSNLIARYGSAGIPVLEIWNEVNLSREWGYAPIDRRQPAQYVHLLKEVYPSAKAIDPNITILSAGLSPTGVADGTAMPDDWYLQRMYDAGLAYYTDGIGLIGNGFGIPPETDLMSDPTRPHPSFYFRRIEQMHDIMVANGDAGKQVWILEHGYTSDPRPESAYSWTAVDEETKAAYIVRALAYAQANWYPWIAQMTVWSFADPEWTPSDEQYWWAITEPDGTPRPAYGAIAAARATGILP
jgi:polysaccharide biosynthesis protein PslG